MSFQQNNEPRELPSVSDHFMLVDLDAHDVAAADAYVAEQTMAVGPELSLVSEDSAAETDSYEADTDESSTSEFDDLSDEVEGVTEGAVDEAAEREQFVWEFALRLTTGLLANQSKAQFSVKDTIALFDEVLAEAKSYVEVRGLPGEDVNDHGPIDVSVEALRKITPYSPPQPRPHSLVPDQANLRRGSTRVVPPYMPRQDPGSAAA